MVWTQVVIGFLQLVMILLMTRYKVLTEKSIGHQFDEKLEKFKQDFQKELFEQERRDKFKLAALDERLKAHQEAYAVALDMIQKAGSEEKEKIKSVRDSYWHLFREKSLYLAPEVRTALNRGFKSFDEYNRLNAIQPGKLGENQLNRMQNCYEEIAGTPGEIMKATEFEIKPDELMILPPNKTNSPRKAEHRGQ